MSAHLTAHRDRCSDPHLEFHSPSPEGLLAAEAEPFAAKLWELLSSHPAFRLKVVQLQRLLTGATVPTGESDEREQAFWAALRPLELGFMPPTPKPPVVRQHRRQRPPPTLHCNPLAWLTFAWCFQPALGELKWPLLRTPGEVGETGWLQARQLEPAWDADRAELEAALDQDLQESPIQDYAADAALAWLDTAWARMPRLFRYYFRWLAEELDPEVMIERPQVWGTRWESNRQGFLKPDGVLLEAGSEARGDPKFAYANLRWEFQTLLEQNLVYSLPRAPISEKELRRRLKFMGQQVRDQLKGAGLVLSSQRVRHYLGSPSAWRDFDAIRPRMSYDVERWDSDAPPLRASSLPHAAGEWERLRRKDARIALSSHTEVHIRKSYETMEALMFATYPELNVRTLLNSALSPDKAAESSPAPAEWFYERRAVDIMQLKLKLLTA